MTPVLRIFLAIPVILLGTEIGIVAWNKSEIEPSKEPVFSWPRGSLVTEYKGRFGLALRTYHADRGLEETIHLPVNRNIELFYFEWDRMEAGPFSALGGHESEVCNVVAGFKVLEAEVPRLAVAHGVPLNFHYTKLAAPDGTLVHVYKLPWLQGYGAWQTGSARDRGIRLKRSFIRHRGAARVLQAGVFGAASESEAWELVQKEIISKLDWAPPPGS